SPSSPPTSSTLFPYTTLFRSNQYALIADKFFGLFNCFMRLWELHDPIKTRVAGQPCFGNPNPLQHMHAFHILGKEKGNFLQYPTVKATMTLKEQLLFTEDR